MSQQVWQKTRHRLHQLAELSNHERKTAQFVIDTLTPFKPDHLIPQVGGHGILAVFDGDHPGPTTLIRAELDALPIVENHHLDYHSCHSGCAHKCGHDGHMAIVLSLAEQLHFTPPIRGRVVLAFQPAEETGEGAAAIVTDDKFAPYLPDYAFALHNYPGMALGHVGVKAGTFNCASKGMIIKLEGSTSHAAYPEHGNSPAKAMCALIELANTLADQLDETCWCTVVYAKLGEIAFGTSPGNAVVMLTLRSETNRTMERLQNTMTQHVYRLSSTYNLTSQISFQDDFRATTNDELAAELVTNVCEKIALECIQLEHPMRWSEDFGRFTEVAKHGALFVLGSGESTQQLHHPDYDFPDALLTVGKNLFVALIREINQFKA
jgi:amidohydrolase